MSETISQLASRLAASAPLTQTNGASAAARAPVLIDLDRCIECGSCAAACHYGHGRLGAVGRAGRGVALLPAICRQCPSAACVAACPNEAMVRDEAGVVRRRLARCVGCGSCAWACPFGVIGPAESVGPAWQRTAERTNGRLVAKCDLCADRDGSAVPRCVSACPAGALLLGGEEGMALLGGRAVGEHTIKRR